jgi:hypothetical protein
VKYLCLVYLEETKLDALSKSEAAALTDESLDYDDVLRDNGHLIAAHALKRTATATTVRVRNGRVLTTDGPFAESKEQLIGFLLIEAKDKDEATELASKVPLARMGSIEVRPI